MSKHWRPHRSKSSNEGWLTSYADLITNLLIFFVLIISASQIQSGKMEKIIQSLSSSTSEPPKSLSQAKKEIQGVLDSEKISNDVHVALTDDGLELSFESGVMFASGRADILDAMQGPLSRVLQSIAQYQDKYRFAIEGHTDEVPISSASYRSNWELSSARALIVREHLETVGVARNKVKVEAYADTKSLDAKALANLSRVDQLAKHRRVVIRLY